MLCFEESGEECWAEVLVDCPEMASGCPLDPEGATALRESHDVQKPCAGFVSRIARCCASSILS